MDRLTVDLCRQKPSFLVGKLKPNGEGIELSQPIVYDGLFAKHTLYGSKTVSHPSKLVKTQWKGGGYFTSLVTGENGVNYMGMKKLNLSLKSDGFMVNMEVRKKQKVVGGILKNVNNEIISDMERKYNVKLIKNTLSVLSINSTGSAPSVATYSKIMKTIQSPNASFLKDFKGSPLEYKRILDYFQFTLVDTVNSNKNLILYRPNSQSIFNSIRDGGDIKSAIKRAYDTSDPQNIRWYNKAIFATVDRPACMASIIRKIDTVYAKKLPDNTAKYYRIKSLPNNIEIIKKLINSDLKQKNIDINTYILKNKILKNRGPYEYFLDREKFSNTNNIERTLVLFYWMFNYPGDNEHILLRHFISLIDTYHDFTGGRAINNNKGGFKNLWPSNTNKFTNKNISIYNTKGILVNNSPFLTKILGKDIYKRFLSKSQIYNTNVNKAKKIVATQNKTNTTLLNNSRKLADLLYFFINLLSVNNNLIRNIEYYIGGDINDNTGGYNAGIIPRMVTKMTGSELCKSLDLEDKNTGNKTAFVIDIFTSRQAPCIVGRSVVHDAGILDPAMGRKALSWGQVLDKCGKKSYTTVDKEFTNRGQNNRIPQEKLNQNSKNEANRLANEKAIRMQRYRNNLEKFLNTLQLSINNKKFFMSNLKNDNLFKLRKLAQEKANNNMIVNARAQLNKLTSLTQIQKNNYIQQIRQNPKSIPIILNNAKRVANQLGPQVPK